MKRFLPFNFSPIVLMFFRYLRRSSFVFLLLLSACSPALTIQRGINMGDMLEAPNEGDWGLSVEEEYFDLIKDASFDFVRLPVRWNAYAEPSAPYSIDPAFFARVDEVLGWALERELSIIIDFHHYEEMASDPVGHKDRFLGIWRQIAEHYQDHPPTVLFELLNEPTNNLNPSLWNEYLNEAVEIVRETNPTRDVIIGPVLSNGNDLFSALEIPKDRHLIVTFHYYLPFQFTHQGAEWVSAEAENWLGTTWDSTEAEKAEITRHFDSVAEWAEQRNVRILLGEFGAYSRASQDSRVRWTEFVAQEAERHGFAWAYWEFASGFGIYDPEAKVWREDLLKALIP
jgi:endoglucanase